MSEIAYTYGKFEHWAKVPWNYVGISTRLSTILSREGIETIGQLDALTDAELLRLPNLGRLTLDEARAHVEAMRESWQREPWRKRA